MRGVQRHFLPMSFFNVSNAAQHYHWARLQLGAVKPVKMAAYFLMYFFDG